MENIKINDEFVILKFKSNLSCIYKIINMSNNKFYVGSTINLRKRWKEHFNKLLINKHNNFYLQSAFNKHGKDNFIIEMIEEVPNKDKLIEKEQYYIDLLNPEYNICKIANSSLGIKRREETKEKVRQANIGLKHPEWRNRIKSIAQGGENHWTKKKKFSE